jgi:prepilin-type processing-associated H-X9-DG protein
MNANKGLTRVDAIIALACVALFLAQAAVLNAGGRERSKKEVCMANLRMLTAAWKAYADDNAGNLVNGGQAPANLVRDAYWCTPRPPVPATDEVGTFPTVRYDWDITLPYAERVSLLKRGALYKYCQDVTVFRCPEADKNMHRSYVMPTSMNAAWTNSGGTQIPGFPLDRVAKNTGQIARPNERIVFLEEKIISPDAFELPINFPLTPLCDAPNIMHGNGINFGFVDGHAEYHQWECQSTIVWASGGYSPSPTDSCFMTKDYAWLRNAIWGE